jgi:hypothetical protein
MKSHSDDPPCWERLGVISRQLATCESAMPRFDDRILSRKTGPVTTPVTESNAFRIDVVHPGSLAAEAGIVAGQYYLPSKLTTSPLELKERASDKPVTSRLVDVAGGEQIELVTQGFPFGIELSKGPAAVAADVLGEFVDADEIIRLAHAGSEIDIERFVTILAEAKSKQNRDLGAVVKGWFGGKSAATDKRALTLDAENYMGVVPHAKLVAAFWLAANRNAVGARRLAEAWNQWGVEKSGSSYAALFFLVVALIRETEGAAGADVHAALHEAVKRAPESKLVADVAATRLPTPAEMPVSLEGRAFPSRYRLLRHDPLEGPPKGTPLYVSYADTVEDLGADQRLLIILLGGYRANGFYARATHRLSELAPLIGRYYKAIHVITAFEEGGRHHSTWMTGEARLRKSGAPVQILYDPGDTVSTALRTTRSPHAYIVDRQGIVHYDGWLLDEGGYWKGLA